MSAPDPAAPGSQISFSYLSSVLERHRRFLVVSTVGLAVLTTTAAILLYLLAGATRATTQAFRVEFEGADQREYPSGKTFTPAEIVSTPVLHEVFTRNALNRYTTFARFKGSVFVSETNWQLDALARDYGVRLIDPKLSAIERDRLAEEYELKKRSLRRSDFELNLVRREYFATVPVVLQKKILTDILAVWAESAVREQGVLRADFEVLPAAVFDDDLTNGGNHFVAADMLRRRVLRLAGNIENLRIIPGAESLREGQGKTSLGELRLSIEELLHFRIEPLLEQVASSDAEVARYINGQVQSVQRDRARAAARVQVVRDSLALYQQRRSASFARPNNEGPGREETTENAREIVPQIDTSFLNSIVQLAVDSRDVDYRQRMINAANQDAMTMIPLDQQLAFYAALGDRRSAAPSIPPDEATRRYRTALAEARAAATAANRLYTLLLDSRSSGKGIYSLTGPARTNFAPGILASRLALLVLTLLMLWLIGAITAVFIRARVMAERQGALATS
jgi:hypothetical protein